MARKLAFRGAAKSEECVQCLRAESEKSDEILFRFPKQD